MNVDPDHLLASLPPVWLRRDALANGYHDRAIAGLVGAGDWHRVRRGGYTGGKDWGRLDEAQRHAQLARVVVRQAQTEVVVSHSSALPFHGAPVWGMPLDVVHLTRPDQHAGRHERGVHQHLGLLLDGDVVERAGLAVTSATRTALDVTTVAGLDGAVVALDNLLHRGLTTMEELRARYSTMEHWPGTLRTDLALRLADGRSESVGETLTRCLCRRHHLPAPVPQYAITDHEGRIVAYVDLAWPERGVFLEFDGRIKYEKLLREGESASEVVVREKRREEMICELTGWRCLRVVWDDLSRQTHTAGRIRRMLEPVATPRAHS